MKNNLLKCITVTVMVSVLSGCFGFGEDEEKVVKKEQPEISTNEIRIIEDGTFEQGNKLQSYIPNLGTAAKDCHLKRITVNGENKTITGFKSSKLRISASGKGVEYKGVNPFLKQCISSHLEEEFKGVYTIKIK